MSDAFTDILEAERFEKHLAQLAAMSPKEKRRYLSRLKRREKMFEENHAAMSEAIADSRAFAAEAEGDENWNGDQPL